MNNVLIILKSIIESSDSCVLHMCSILNIIFLKEYNLNFVTTVFTLLRRKSTVIPSNEIITVSSDVFKVWQNYLAPLAKQGPEPQRSSVDMPSGVVVHDPPLAHGRQCRPGEQRKCGNVGLKLGEGRSLLETYCPVLGRGPQESRAYCLVLQKLPRGIPGARQQRRGCQGPAQ